MRSKLLIFLSWLIELIKIIAQGFDSQKFGQLDRMFRAIQPFFFRCKNDNLFLVN